jgi:pimeloyl-ACP methyl ester carboxylesterase
MAVMGFLRVVVIATVLNGAAAARRKFPAKMAAGAAPAAVPEALSAVEENSSSIVAFDPKSSLYNEEEAVQFAHFARSAYCRSCHLEAWSCGDACRSVDVVPNSVIVIGPGAQHQVQGFVARLPGQGSNGGARCVVSFRGSENVDNWLANLQFLMRPWNWLTCRMCMVHSGFADAYEELEQEMNAALDRNRCTTTAVTGHSLGGAIGALATFRLRRIRRMHVNPVYLFGMPRVGDRNWAAAFAATAQDGLPAAWRIVQHLDPVVRVPPAYLAFRHFPTEVFYAPGNERNSLIRNGDTYRVCSDTDGEDPECAAQHCTLFSACLPFTVHHATSLGLNFWNVLMPATCMGSCSALAETEANLTGAKQ